MKKDDKQHGALCECAYCRNKKPFVIPAHLLDAIKSGNVVVFAGAGISTEDRTYAQHTLYDQISRELGRKDVSFPALMSEYCSLPDGRSKLIEIIRDRFRYQYSFNDIYRGTIRFHRAIGAIHTIDTVITTNWDTLFEDEGGFEPFVYDADLAFWSSARKKVLKIHGSITNAGSIVATEEDYVKSYRRLSSGPLGAQLKSIISTKTIVYAGYSLRDENYLKIIKIISTMMKGHVKHSYFVSPYADTEDLSRFPVPVTPISTDGAYFFETLRKEISEEIGISKDSSFEKVSELLDFILEMHQFAADDFVKKPTASLFVALAYQDGLIHACQRIVRLKNFGEYHSLNHVHDLVHGYMSKESVYIKSDRYWDASYCSGYKNGMLFLLGVDGDADFPFPPLFELAHEAFEDIDSFAKLKRMPRYKMPAGLITEFMKYRSLRSADGSTLVPDHTPFV